MSKLTNFAENLIADFIRGQGLSLATDFTLELLTAVSDSAHTKVTGTDYAPVTVARSLAAWAGTQGAGTTLASSGTSHQTSNNGLVDFGAAGAGGWSGPIIAVGLFSSTNLVCWAEIDARTVADGEEVSFAAGAIVFTLGLTSGMSDYFANKLIDLIFRAQAYSMPANLYAAYTTTAPTNAGGGTEPSVGGYARVAVPSTLSGWGPTQGDLSTDASSGTGGRIGNRAAIIFPAPSADQGTAGWAKLMDASTSGNLMLWRALAQAKSVLSSGPAPRFPIDDFGITIA